MFEFFGLSTNSRRAMRIERRRFGDRYGGYDGGSLRRTAQTTWILLWVVVFVSSRRAVCLYLCVRESERGRETKRKVLDIHLYISLSTSIEMDVNTVYPIHT